MSFIDAINPNDEVPLTERQESILTYLYEYTEQHNYPPSVREICEAVGLRSPSSVHAQLNTLEDKGFLRRDPTKPRALELAPVDEYTVASMPLAHARHVPLVGEIAAGTPILAEEQVEEVYPLPKDIVGDGTLFMLRVRGESMIEAGVHDRDYVVIREQPNVEQGEMCAALIDGEATVKFFRRTTSGDVFLDPANESYEPIPVGHDSDAVILGRVTAVLRSL